MATADATKKPTIEEYVEAYRELTVSFDTMHLKEKATFPVDSSGVTDGLLMSESFINKYRGDLEEIVTTMTFDRENVRKYYCNPWALSYDLYGSVEFWFLLLDLNNMYSATDFTKKTIKVYNQSLPELVDTIMNMEESFINANDEEINGTDNTDVNDSDDDGDIEEDEE